MSPGVETLGIAGELGASPGEGADTMELLTRAGVRNLRRRLSQAEIHSLRKALAGVGPGEDLPCVVRLLDSVPAVVGYVCSGRWVPAGGPRVPTEGRFVRLGPPPWQHGAERAGLGLWAALVADHVNLTWVSPLTGPNDERIGPRFPVMSGLYSPDAMAQALGKPPTTAPIAPVVVAGVKDDRTLDPFESAVARWHGLHVVSAELVPVAIIAAHMGLRVSAAVVVDGGCTVASEAAELAAALMGPERRG